MLRPAFRKIILLTAAFSVFLTLSVSCKDDSIEVNNVTGGHITISPLLTRVTDTAFENDDRIGLTILIGEERFSENSPMEYSDGIFSGDLTWYEDTGTGSEFFAYHPYDGAGIPESFSVSSDQSEGTSASDLVIGTKSNVKPTAESVKMTFRHVLSKITVKMTNSTGADIESLSFEGARNTADVDIFSSEVSVSEASEAADIKAFESAKNQYYTAIFIPQEVTLTLSIVTSDSKKYAMELEPMTLLQGKQYEVTARLSEEHGLEVKVAGDVENWGDGGEIGPGELPELEDVDDVCEKMDDLEFMSYCYKNFDVNGDGKVSMAEANAVRNIDSSTASSFKGIEYFTNLETLKASSVEFMDLRYNTKLTSINISQLSTATLDLSGHVSLTELKLTSSTLTELDLSRNTELSDIRLSCSSLKKITFADKTRITEITSSNFSGCSSSLEEIILPDGITSIGDNSFKSFKNLSSIDLPQSLRSIGGSAFSYCDALTSVELPQSLTSIGSYAFSGCSALTSIELPQGLTSIGSSAFYDCTNLSSVTINSDRIAFDENPFRGCPCHFWGYGASEDNLLIIQDNTLIAASSLIQGQYDLPQGLTSIGTFAFYRCSALTFIELPQGLTSIGSSAFFYCSALTSIELPQGLTSIGGSAFYGCSALTSIELPQGLTSIVSYAFYDCSALTSIELPQGLTSIGLYAFSGCSALTSIELPQGLTSIDLYAFYDCSSLESINASKCISLESIGSAGFWNVPVKMFSLGALNPPRIYSSFNSGLDAVLKVSAESIETYRSSDWARYFSSIEALETI